MDRDRNLDSEISSERLIELCERTLDHQVVAIQKKATTAMDLVKINLIIAGLIITILEFGSSVSVSPSEAKKIAAAFLFLLLGIVLAMIARFRSNGIYGPNGSGLALIGFLREQSEADELAEAYIYWSKENQNRIAKIERFLVASVCMTLCTLAYLSVAVVVIV